MRFVYFFLSRDGIVGSYFGNELKFIDHKTSDSFDIDRKIDGLGYKHYPTDFHVKIDSEKDVIISKFHSKLPIETKPEYMTDEFKPSEYELGNNSEIQFTMLSLSKYVIIPQYFK